MLPLQSEDEVILFEDPLFLEEGIKNFEDLFSDNAVLQEGKGVISSSVEMKKRKRDYGAGNESTKIMHRDIERQRRQEMAGLYALLRSLLPLKYIKGKRSACDQIHEAENYINYVQKNIKEMQMKRDQLKQLSNLSENLKNNSTSPCSVEVNPCRDGVEILITSPNEENFRFSRVLSELLGRGLNAVSCDSTRVNGKSLHRIQLEAHDQTTLDPSELRDILTNVINLC